jgi:hypothetical protein
VMLRCSDWVGVGGGWASVLQFLSVTAQSSDIRLFMSIIGRRNRTTIIHGPETIKKGHLTCKSPSKSGSTPPLPPKPPGTGIGPRPGDGTGIPKGGSPMNGGRPG